MGSSVWPVVVTFHRQNTGSIISKKQRDSKGTVSSWKVKVARKKHTPQTVFGPSEVEKYD